MQSKQVLCARSDQELPDIPSDRWYWILPPGGLIPVRVEHPSKSLVRTNTAVDLVTPEADLQTSYRALGLELVARSAYAASDDGLNSISPSAHKRWVLRPMVFAWGISVATWKDSRVDSPLGALMEFTVNIIDSAHSCWGYVKVLMTTFFTFVLVGCVFGCLYYFYRFANWLPSRRT